MKKLLTALPLLAIFAFATPANAQEKLLGGEFSAGTPYGVSTGLEMRVLHIPWFKVGVSGTYLPLLSGGIKTNLLIDPIKFPLVPVVNVEMGWQSPFTIPGLAHSPAATFTYENIEGGIGIGSREGTRFLLMGGMSHINGSTSNFDQALPSHQGAIIGSPTFSAWVPSFKLGVNFLFL